MIDGGYKNQVSRDIKYLINFAYPGVITLSNWSFCVVAVFIALVDFFIPFYILKNVSNFFGNYLFWSLLTLGVIVTGLFYVHRTWGSKG
jgi:hypothetical protein